MSMPLIIRLIVQQVWAVTHGDAADEDGDLSRNCDRVIKEHGCWLLPVLIFLLLFY